MACAELFGNNIASPVFLFEIMGATHIILCFMLNGRSVICCKLCMHRFYCWPTWFPLGTSPIVVVIDQGWFGKSHDGDYIF